MATLSVAHRNSRLGPTGLINPGRRTPDLGPPISVTYALAEVAGDLAAAPCAYGVASYQSQLERPR